MMRKRDPIMVTAAAWTHISGILASNPNTAFRIGVDTKGCAGHKYRYDLVGLGSLPPTTDQITSDLGIIALDPSGVMYLLGSTLDLSTDGISSQLVWHNPLATGSCGCGESFSTKGSCGN